MDVTRHCTLTREGEIMQRALRALSSRLIAAGFAKPRTHVAAAAAWSAWRAAEIANAEVLAGELIEAGIATDDARHIRVLVRHVRGDEVGAIADYEAIDPAYRRLHELDEPMLWSVWRAMGPTAAREFSDRRRLTRNKVTRERLRLAVDHPLTVLAPDLVELPFTNDALSSYMPGVAGRINGHATVARLDTGGAFVHMTPVQAETFGVDTVACEREFASLNTHRVCHGIVDLELGSARLINVPVAVHADIRGAETIAAATGVELGPLIGTNVLEQFLSTVDSPGQRFILSKRRDPTAASAHQAKLSPHMRSEVAFGLWLDHFMIASGHVGRHEPMNFFIDSGLVAFTPDQGQAAMLAPYRTLRSWGVTHPASESFCWPNGGMGIGMVTQTNTMTFAIPDRTWRAFGDWGGIRVDALLAYGYLKHYSWTIDFDRRVYQLRD